MLAKNAPHQNTESNSFIQVSQAMKATRSNGLKGQKL